MKNSIPVEMHSIDVASDEHQVAKLLRDYGQQLYAELIDIFCELYREGRMHFAKSLTTGKLLLVLLQERENSRYFVVEEEGFRRIF